MLTKASKCPTKLLQEVSEIIVAHKDFLKDNLRSCSSQTDVANALTASDSWFILGNGPSPAVLKLQISERSATVSQICTNTDSIPTLISRLREEVGAMRLTKLTVRVLPDEVQPWVDSGFQRTFTCAQFSRAPVVSNMMPLLPLSNPTEKDLLPLSQLMYAAYAKTDESLPDVRSAEASLRETMSGAGGAYLPDASFASGAAPNLVSACLIATQEPGEAEIVRLFTHPLYRARGLATTEIAAAMNRLSASGVKSVSAWNREGDEVVRRLLAKMGFEKRRGVVEVSASV